MSAFMCEQPFPCDWCREIDGTNRFSSLTSASSDALCCEVYAVCSCTSFAMNCVAQIFFWCLMSDLVSYLFSWFLLDVMQNRLCDVLVVMIFHVMFWDPFVVCWWDTHVSPCVFALRSLLCHVGRMIIMHEFFVILIGVLLTESSCSGTSLLATLVWGNFPCMIKTSPLIHIITFDST